MVIKTRRQENLASSWIAAEAIYFLKNEHPWLTEKWVEYIRTRIQKILFHVAEKHNLNITRCWYMFGAFVPASELFSNFSSFSKRYVKSKRGPIKYRNIVKKYINNFDEVLEDIIKTASFIDKFRTVDEYLDYLYNNEAPVKYKDCYIYKHELTRSASCFNIISQINDYETHKIEKLENIDKFYNDITNFQMAVFSYNNEEQLENNTMLYFNELEDSIRKIEFLIRKDYDILDYPFNIIEESKDIFTNYVWKPYACEIARETAQGLRKTTIRSYSRRWKKDALNNFTKKLLNFSKKRIKSKLNLSWNESKEYFKINENKELDKKIIKLISIYNKIQEE